MVLMGEYTNLTSENVKDINYNKVKKEDMWKVCIASEAYEVSNGNSEIEMFEQSEMAAVLRHICVS